MEFKKINFKKFPSLRIPEAFGVDFNDRVFRAMQLKKTGKNCQIKGWIEKKIPQGIVDSMMVAKKEDFKNFIIEALKHPQDGKIRGKGVVVSIPENKIFIRVIKIPLMEENEAGESVKFEAESSIPISLDEAYLDWQVVRKRKKDMDVLVVAVPKKIIDNYLEAFEYAGFQVIAFEPKSIAIGRSITHPAGEEYDLVVDMGLENTNFAIYEKGFPIFTSSGSISGKMLTDLVMKQKGLNLAKAESYKIKVGLGISPEEKQESFEIFEPALVSLVDETKRTISFFKETLASQRMDNNKDDDKVGISLKKIILTGGGSNLKGLGSYLSINLQETIEQSNPWVNVRFKNNVPPISKEESQGFSTVIGLALRAQEYESYN